MNRGLRRLLVLPILICMIGGVLLLKSTLQQQSPETLLTQTEIALETNDYETVFEKTRELEEFPEFRIRAKTIQATALARIEAFPQAEKILRNLSPTGAEREEILLTTIELLYRQENLTRALELVQGLIAEMPDSVGAHRWAASIHYDLGSLALTEQHFQQIARLAPEDYRPYRLLGQIHLDFEQYAEAIEDYRALLERNPPEQFLREGRLKLIDALLRQRRPEEAYDLIQQAGHPKELKLAEARCLFHLGKLEQAMEVLASLPNAFEDDPARLRLLGNIALLEGDVTRGVEYLELANKRNPNDVETLYQLALAYRQAGNQAAYETTMGRKTHVEALYNEMTELSKQILIETSNVEIRLRLAEICRELGLNDLALVWERAAKAIRKIPMPPSRQSAKRPETP